ncbi:hypothetical protein [Jiella avicenniae]|uniref:Uncharacterized protein n=1 Tax=Jiella avicenniae TaxID=2907202 RepID=A0A9X1NYN4_9HYPH|nr:hypothetical protein [Jiella avicenniae]MCE7026806.1 hypothetical protein [Jiella avicenniae]
MATVPTARDEAEAIRMVDEKILATAESVIAVQTAIARASCEAVIAAMTGRHGADRIDAIVSAGLRPYSKRVRANHRRLSRPPASVGSKPA